jgi:hypothetical protein
VIGLAIWREWWAWFCSRAFWFDARSFLSWLKLEGSWFSSITSVPWGEFAVFGIHIY